MQESLKSVIAQYNASQLLTMREVSPFNPDTSAFQSCLLTTDLKAPQ